MREIADTVGAYLMADMAHISGLVATRECNSPFEHCHVVTSTTHKSLRGPRSGIIFSRKEYSEAIDSAVFPALQGGPHNHQIAALAVALQEASLPSFKTYIQQVKANAKALAAALVSRGYVIVTGGTDNHLVLWDARNTGLSGAKLEKLLEMVDISVNKNTLMSDVSAVSPGGIRLGTPAMTTRGMKEEDMVLVAELIGKVVKQGQGLQEKALKEEKNVKKLADFFALLEASEDIRKELEEIKKEVLSLSSRFPLPGLQP